MLAHIAAADACIESEPVQQATGLVERDSCARDGTHLRHVQDRPQLLIDQTAQLARNSAKLLLNHLH